MNYSVSVAPVLVSLCSNSARAGAWSHLPCGDRGWEDMSLSFSGQVMLH